MRRIVITGMGILSPLGRGIKINEERILAGHSGLRHVASLKEQGVASTVAGLVPSKAEDEFGFDLSDVADAKDIRRSTDFILYAVETANQAVEDSGIKSAPDFDPSRVAVVIGSGVGGLSKIRDNSKALCSKGVRGVGTFFIPSCLVNMAAGWVSIKHGFTGPQDSPIAACATGAHAITSAIRMMRNGEVDRAVVGGTEDAVCDLASAGFSAMKALSTSFNDRPTEASRPWDEQRDGFVMSNGSGMLVLEDYDMAKKRGAKIYAEILGFGHTSDAYHIAAPQPSGLGARNAMFRALASAELNPDQVDYINAHGTSTPAGDAAEAQAVRDVFNANRKSPIPMSSTKSSVGHLLGAAGIVEAIYSVFSLQRNIAPPTLNLHKVDPKCADCDFIPLTAREMKIDIVCSNSFGFGGSNASIIFGKV